MSADIQKESVFDDRIIQSPPRYAVEKGALSLTNAPFNAIASTASQQTFNIYVPSENVFVDRALRWSGTAYFRLDVTASVAWLNDQSKPYLTPILTYGTDISISPLPLNYLCQTMTATINDTTSVINSQDVLMEVMRLTNYKKNLLQRTCPTMLDKYQWNGTALRCINDPMAGYAEAMNVDEQPNGAFSGFVWTDPAGVPLTSLSASGATSDPLVAGGVRGSYTTTNQTGASVTVGFAGGVPTTSVDYATTPATAPVTFPLFFSIRSTEKLVLSPFVFADDQEEDTGLFGINNIQLIMNFKSGSALQRLVRTRSNGGLPSAFVAPGEGEAYPTGSAPVMVANSLNWNTNPSSVWANATMNVQFLTPSLDVPLPPKSVVPYMEFPRYITQQQNGVANPGQVVQLQSQTITLPQIPDLLLIYVKATQVPGQPDPQGTEYADCYLPLASAFNSSVKNPLSINFDNFSGLLSSHTTEELYQMAVSNGLQMPWNVWSGQALSENAVPAGQLTYQSGGNTVYSQPYQMAGSVRSTVGGFLVLKPSKDITLQPGQAPSLVGNFTLQFNLSVVNTFNFQVQPTLYVITANSGFFESIRGSSRIIKGVLSEQDIISAPMASAQTRGGLKRLVGGMAFDGLSNIFSKAKNIYDQTKPAMSAIKNLLPSEGMMGKVKGAMGAVGYGGDAMGAGGAMGAGRRKGLSARLM